MTAHLSASPRNQIVARFLNMATLIAQKHDCELEINMEEKWIDFKTGNVTQQCIEDLMALFEDYEC